MMTKTVSELYHHVARSTMDCQVDRLVLNRDFLFEGLNCARDVWFWREIKNQIYDDERKHDIEHRKKRRNEYNATKDGS